MSKSDTTAKKIIILAYFHRYGWIAAMLGCIGCIAIWPEQMLYSLSISAIAFSIWSFVGYKLKWRHIYCSFQNAYREKMTPHSTRWSQIKKSDAYGVPLIFLIIGLMLLCVGIIY